jgi:hypothetical protein
VSHCTVGGTRDDFLTEVLRTGWLTEGDRSDSPATRKTPGKLDTVVEFSKFIVPAGVSNESTDTKIQAN